MALLDVIILPLLLISAVAPTEARLLRARAATATSHPVENIISLLQRLDHQAGEEGKSEQLTYQKFEHWCVRSEKELQESIAKLDSELEALADNIISQQGTMDALDSQIASLVEEQGELDRVGAKADRNREAGSSLYGNRTESLNGTISAVREAIVALTDAREDTEPELLQRHIGKVLEVASEHLSVADLSLLQNVTRPDLRASGDYEEHIDEYAFKSHGVIEMLKKLLQDFEAQELDTNKAETNAINAHNLAHAARQDLFDAAQGSIVEKTDAHGVAEGLHTQHLNEQRDARSDLSADKATLSSTEQACNQKAAEWAERSKVRSEEREAIHIAIGILVKVSGVRTAAPENPVLPQPFSFLELPKNPEFEKALELLRQDARVSHSSAIAQLAAAVAAHDEGPFDQAINSIEKMIFHLMNEQREEDDHKHWCDLELEKTQVSISEKEDKYNDLGEKRDVAMTRAERLRRDIEEADDDVKDVVVHMTEAAEIRKTGREENALAIKDAEAAQTALTQAIEVLTTFYKSSGSVQKKDWEFIQEPVELDESPETWDSKYSAVADPMDDSNGVLKLLEHVLAEFTSMESSTIAQEDSDQHAFEQDMKDCKIQKARWMKESEGKAAERKNVLERQRSLDATLTRVATEMSATKQYLSDLAPACVNGDSTYQDRKSARSQEITALKAAQDHLHNAFQNVTQANETQA